MRLLHTADWHLGRTLFEARLLDDQAHVLDQIIAIAAQSRIDAVVVAGDLYDRAVPPADAVRLLDEVFDRLVRGHAIPVIAIAGNHDGAERLAFGSTLLGQRGLHLRALPDATVTPVTLEDGDGPLDILPVPYAEPAAIRALCADEAVVCHDSAFAALCRRMHADRPSGRRTVLVAHAFVAGGSESQSERSLLQVGGASVVDAATLQGFDAVLLGHLHRPQTIGTGSSAPHYAGSPLKYSASEIDHSKSVTIVEIGAPGTAARLEPIPLSPRRDLRRVTGHLADLLGRPPEGSPEDYVIAHLLDEGPVHDAMARLRQVYPYALAVERPATKALSTGVAADRAHRRLDAEALFARFWVDMTGQDPTPAERDAYRRAEAAGRDDKAPSDPSGDEPARPDVPILVA